MAKVEGEYIAVNELFGNKSGSALGVKGLRHNGAVGRRAVINGVIKFDHWYTTLSASDFSVSSSGGYVASLASISSYGVDVGNETHELGYDLSKDKIDANNTSSSKTHPITITQKGSGLSLNITATQAARKYSYTVYYTPSVTSTSIGTFAASGKETKYLTVYWTQSYRDYYDNGTYTSGSTSGSSTATITSGSANNSSGAYISNGGIYCPSAGKNPYSSTRTVYTISDYYFYANGEYGSGGTVYVYQSANTVSTSTGSLVLSVSSSVSNFSSSGGKATISYQSYKPYTKTWTSGESESGETSISATLSTTYGSLGTSSVSGKGSTTLEVGKDTGDGKTATVTIKAEGTSRTVSITQTKRVEKSRAYDAPIGTPANIATVAVTGNVTVYLTIASWTQSYTITYDNSTTSTGSTSGTNASATVTKGSGVDGTYINNGGVYIPNAGTNYYTTDRTAYTITGYSFTANGKTANVTGNIAIKQKANTRTETPEYYLTFISQSATSIANSGGTFTFVAESLMRTKYTYLTNQTAYSTFSNSEASVTYSNGVIKVSPSTISGKQTVTVTVGSNYDSARTPKVIVTSKKDSSKTLSVTVSQAAASYDFYFVNPGTIDAYGATLNITLVSKVNGTFKEVIKDTVKLSGGTVNSITANSSEGKYSVNVTFPANSSTTSTKSYTISAQQYNTGKTTSITITQAKKTSSYVTGSVAINNLVSGLYVTSDGMLQGFNQYPTFTITAASNGTVNSCTYRFCLDFEIQTSNGQTFTPRYEHQMDFIEVAAFSGTKTIQFVNFPMNFNLQELTEYMFDPYYSSVTSIRVIADIERVSGEGLLMLGGSMNDYTWYV